MQTHLELHPPKPDPGSRRPLAARSSRLVVLILLAAGPAVVGASPAGAQPAPLPSAALTWTAGRLPAPAWQPPMAFARVVPSRSAPSEGVWPLGPRPTVVEGFHPPASRWSAGHRGVDLAGAPAAAVHSSLPGTVTFAGRIAGRGVVVVSHGGTRTTYEPVAAGVAVGDRVGAGTVLGTLQLFGSHCFPGWCLHWGLIEGRDGYLDPLTLVGAAPVRLLPLGGPGMPASLVGEG